MVTLWRLIVIAFHPDWCDRDETGMIGTVSGMKTPENGMKTPEKGMGGDSRRGTGSGGDCFKMFKTLGWKPNSNVTQNCFNVAWRDPNGFSVAWRDPNGNSVP